MKKEDRINIALTSFKEGYNCTQSVLSAWPELISASRDSVMKLSSGFGAGMGRLQETCGALTGAYMVIGLSRDINEPEEIRKEFICSAIQELTSKFVILNRETTCRNLIKVDMNTAAGREQQKLPEIRERVCEKCVSDSVAILYDIVRP